MDYLYEEEILKTSKVESKNMWETLKWICQEKLQVSESDIVENLNETCKQFAVYFKEASTIDALVDNVPRIIENRAITYDENVDKICFIFDCDRDSFVAHSGKNQYEDVLNICRKRKFGFYLTNPCFEFWYLLHFQYTTKFFKDYPAVKNALTTYLPDYEKTGDVYSQLSAHTTNALQNAKRVEQYHLQNGSSKPFGIAVNPFTDIYQLVESLL